LTLAVCDTSKGKAEEIMNNVTHQGGGNTVTSEFIVQPDFKKVESTIVVAYATPSLSRVAT